MNRSASTSVLPWIEVAPDAPYFVTEAGDPWTPIGQNDAITWPELAGAFRRRDMASVERYFELLQASGVTVLRLMLEYSQGRHRYFERPAGMFQPNMVRLWDDMIVLCERFGLRLLLTPYDTFWMWLHWSKHPYNRQNGGPCADRNQWLLSQEMRTAIKQRFAFAVERWGGSGAIFAWDLWNELHPAHGGNSTAPFADFITELSEFVRITEVQHHGRAHPQTVSYFGPTILENPTVAEVVYGHPLLDFASTHFYERDTIDCPRNTVDPAVSTGKLIREALAHIHDLRPFFDSEHGPIHLFKDRHITLPAAFDDEYFRNMQWAHFAAGGAGGGMRWPNRHPHKLTRGMRAAQAALARFLPLIDWQQYRRRNLNDELGSSAGDLALSGSGDEDQAVVWLVRTDTQSPDGTLCRAATPVPTTVSVPGLRAGDYRVTAWDTCLGAATNVTTLRHQGQGNLYVPLLPIVTDLAVAICRCYRA